MPPHGCQGSSQCGACFSGYKGQPWVPSQGPFLWALHLLLLIIFALFLHPPPSSEPRLGLALAQRPLCCTPEGSLSLSLSTFPSPPPPLPPPYPPSLPFPIKVSSLHKYEIIGKIELAACGDSGQNV